MLNELFKTLNDFFSNPTTPVLTSVPTNELCAPVHVTCPSYEAQLNTLIAIEAAAALTFFTIGSYFICCTKTNGSINNANQVPHRLQRSHNEDVEETPAISTCIKKLK